MNYKEIQEKYKGETSQYKQDRDKIDTKIRGAELRLRLLREEIGGFESANEGLQRTIERNNEISALEKRIETLKVERFNLSTSNRETADVVMPQLEKSWKL